MTAISTTLRSTFSDHFHQDEFATFNVPIKFQSYNTVIVRDLTLQRVTSQSIFRFINKDAVGIGCEFFQDCINGLAIDGRIYKKGGVKLLPFFLIPLPRIAKK